MPGLENPNMVDVVAQDPDGEIAVVMVETRPWTANPDQVEQLKQKINAYAHYVLDGTLTQHYPQAADKPVRIQLDCPEPPTSDIAALIDWATGQLRAYGISFRVNARGY